MIKHILISLLLTSLVLPLTANARGKIGSVGIGGGMQYGSFGINYSHAITENFYLSIGAGDMLTAEGIDTDENGETKTVYSFGIKYYLKDRSVTWRPYFTALYGTNGAIEKVKTTKNEFLFFSSTVKTSSGLETFEGISIGIGQSIGFGANKRHGIDMNIMYRIDDGGFDDRLSELKPQGFTATSQTRSDTQLSLGYHFNF